MTVVFSSTACGVLDSWAGDTARRRFPPHAIDATSATC